MKCHFCGEKDNVIITTMGPAKRAICHVCYNQASRCIDGLKYDYTILRI